MCGAAEIGEEDCGQDGVEGRAWAEVQVVIGRDRSENGRLALNAEKLESYRTRILTFSTLGMISGVWAFVWDSCIGSAVGVAMQAGILIKY
jgi:hypothetical protein